MLVIKRRLGEILWIGDCKVTAAPSGTGVKFYITAPDEIQIVRGELKEENECLPQKQDVLRTTDAGHRRSG